MVQIQCQPPVTAGARKGLSKPVFHPRQISVQKTQGLGLLWVTFPSWSLITIHGLWLLHTTALISIKPLPLLFQPFFALIPHRMEAWHAQHMALIGKRAEGLPTHLHHLWNRNDCPHHAQFQWSSNQSPAMTATQSVKTAVGSCWEG